MATLTSIAQNALYEMSGFEVPQTFYGNGNLTARQCLKLVEREGKTLTREHRWAELISEYTFPTVSGTATYDFPSDFSAFANMTFWDRTNSWRIQGPTPPLVYQWLKSGITVASDAEAWYMVRGNKITIYPTPSSVRTIAFDYYSNGWITKQSDSSYISEFTSDNDVPRLDADLLTLGLKWRFLQAKGMPYEPEYKEYCAVKEALVADNGSKGMIDLGMGRRSVIAGGHLPDTGYGA